MNQWLHYLREFNFISVMLRLFLALLFGGAIGIERERKGRGAGFRTYMLVCLGATITILLGQYQNALMTTVWSEQANSARADVARFGAQVINGIGFLGAGTILLTNMQEVKGLTTAAGLWASACMGLAIGAGFYECVFFAVVFILVCMRLLPVIENFIVERSRNVNLYLEFLTLDDFGSILTCIKALNVQIYEIDISHGEADHGLYPSANLSLLLSKKLRRESLLAEISKLDNVVVIKEV